MTARGAGRAVLQVAGLAWAATSLTSAAGRAMFGWAEASSDLRQWLLLGAAGDAVGIAVGAAVFAAAGPLSRRLSGRFEGAAFLRRLAEVLVGLWCGAGLLGWVVESLPWGDFGTGSPFVDEDGATASAFYVGARALVATVLLVGPSRLRAALVLPRASEPFPDAP